MPPASSTLWAVTTTAA